MKIFTGLLLASLMALAFVSSHLSANEVTINASTGDQVVLDVQPQDSFLNVLESISQCFDPALDNQEDPAISLEKDFKQFSMDVFVAGSKISKVVAKQPKNVPRNYWAATSEPEKADVTLILKTLATESWYDIINKRKLIEDAGDRVDHLHPFKWLLCILGDPKLLSYLNMIYDFKGITLKEFLKGTVSSLAQESSLGNLKPEYVQDFAAKLHISPNALNPLLDSHRWKDFVKVAKDSVPRPDGSDRYGQ